MNSHAIWARHCSDPPYHAEHTRPRQISQVKQSYGSVSTWIGDGLGTPSVVFVLHHFCRLFCEFCFGLNSVNLGLVGSTVAQFTSIRFGSNHGRMREYAFSCIAQSISIITGCINQSIILHGQQYFALFGASTAEPSCTQTVEKQTILQYLSSSPTAVNVPSSCLWAPLYVYRSDTDHTMLRAWGDPVRFLASQAA